MQATPVAERSRLALSPLPAVLTAIVSVQAGAALAKRLFPALGPSAMAGARVALASLVLLVIFRPPLRRLTRAQWAAVVPYGVALGTMNVTYYEAIARIPLGLGVTLEFTGPLLVAVAGSRRAIDLAWVALAAAGIAVIAPWSSTTGALDPLGVVLALVAGGFWGAYIVFGGRVSRVLPEGQGTAAGMLVAAVIAVPFALASGGLARMTPPLFAATFGVALLSSAVPQTLEMFVLGVLPARTFGVLMSLEPAVAALIGLVALRERLSPSHWLSIALVSIASAGATLTARRPTPLAEP